MPKLYRILLWVQAIYFFLTALWGLVDIDSFMAVTGPKADIWLVKTVSVLLIPIVISMLCGIFLDAHPLHVILVAGTAAAVLAFIDFYYTANNTIRNVYALDGIVETLFVLSWIYLLLQYRSRKRKV
jgi:hypothetical protein